MKEEPVHQLQHQRSAAKTTVKQPEKQRPAASSKITPMRSSRRANQASSMEVCVIKPASMEDTREIADTLLDNATVILNLEGIDVELAQRIIDFASGACYSSEWISSEDFQLHISYLDRLLLTLQGTFRIFLADLHRP